MYLSNPSKFVHRRKADATFDSICLQCFVIVDSGNEEEDLDVSEYIHTCDLQVLRPLVPFVQGTWQTAA